LFTAAAAAAAGGAFVAGDPLMYLARTHAVFAHALLPLLLHHPLILPLLLLLLLQVKP
jgi:hypothetical protein